MGSKPTPEQQGTIDALLQDSQRKSGSFPLRRVFVQQGTQREPSPGPLAGLVRAHDERALDLFLLHRAVASSFPWDVTRDARIWARALGLATPTDTGVAAVSKAWKRLEGHQLVSRGRRGRLATVTALLEDGSGQEYTDPDRQYFRVPFAYWIDEQAWYRTLSFAAKTMLLIGMSLRPGFVMPQEKVKSWYGISADTAGRGLRELRAAGLLREDIEMMTDYRSPTGQTVRYHYTLTAPFARPIRSQPKEPLAVSTS